MATEITLKPCPCCGGDHPTVKDRVEPYGSRKQYRVICSSGDIRTDWYSTPEAAAEAWNRREGEDNLLRTISGAYDWIEAEYRETNDPRLEGWLERYKEVEGQILTLLEADRDQDK